MTTKRSPARETAEVIAAMLPSGQLLEHPLRAANVSWMPRDFALPATVEHAAEMTRTIARIAERARVDAGVSVAIEGLRRVMVGGRSGARGSGERFTALVVHVIADDEPARTVFLPLE